MKHGFFSRFELKMGGLGRSFGPADRELRFHPSEFAVFGSDAQLLLSNVARPVCTYIPLWGL